MLGWCGGRNRRQLLSAQPRRRVTGPEGKGKGSVWSVCHKSEPGHPTSSCPRPPVLPRPSLPRSTPTTRIAFSPLTKLLACLNPLLANATSSDAPRHQDGSALGTASQAPALTSSCLQLIFGYPRLVRSRFAALPVSKPLSLVGLAVAFLHKHAAARRVLRVERVPSRHRQRHSASSCALLARQSCLSVGWCGRCLLPHGHLRIPSARRTTTACDGSPARAEQFLPNNFLLIDHINLLTIPPLQPIPCIDCPNLSTADAARIHLFAIARRPISSAHALRDSRLAWQPDTKQSFCSS